MDWSAGFTSSLANKRCSAASPSLLHTAVKDTSGLPRSHAVFLLLGHVQHMQLKENDSRKPFLAYRPLPACSTKQFVKYQDGVTLHLCRSALGRRVLRSSACLLGSGKMPRPAPPLVRRGTGCSPRPTPASLQERVDTGPVPPQPVQTALNRSTSRSLDRCFLCMCLLLEKPHLPVALMVGLSTNDYRYRPSGLEINLPGTRHL